MFLEKVINRKWLAYWSILRPKHWIKNNFIFVPAFFGQKMVETISDPSLWLTFIGFCAASSWVYIFNDSCDIKYDREHPYNKGRPLASGRLDQNDIFKLAGVLSLVLVIVMIPYGGWWPVLLYLSINILYSVALKEVIVLDVVIISAGYLLRIWAGALSSQVVLSWWLLIMTFILALCLGLGKRRAELLVWMGQKPSHKALPYQSSISILNRGIPVLIILIVILYTLYCFSGEVIRRFGNDQIYVTLVFVIPGAYRYYDLLFHRTPLASPMDILFQDRLIQVYIIGWVVLFFFIIY